jgi:hypothetical protein
MVTYDLSTLGEREKERKRERESEREREIERDGNFWSLSSIVVGSWRPTSHGNTRLDREEVK